MRIEKRKSIPQISHIVVCEFISIRIRNGINLVVTTNAAQLAKSVSPTYVSTNEQTKNQLFPVGPVRNTGT
jgi:hypothetical protein